MIDGQQQWLDPLSDRVAKGVQGVYQSAGEAGRTVQDALHGTWMGHPFHAAVTDVPLGAWTSAAVMDAMHEVTGEKKFGKAADTAIAIGLAGAVVAAAGLTDWSATDGRARRIGMMHGLLNVTGSLLYAASWWARRRGNRATGRGLSTLGLLVAGGSAYLGGKLVYGERIGVDHTAGLKLPEEFRPVIPAAELEEGSHRKVDVDGTEVLLARREGQVYAVADTCSHLGGPLSEGEFRGNSVRCPWHGSEFCLQDGHVIHGPATHPAPTLEVREKDGQIEVRARVS